MSYNDYNTAKAKLIHGQNKYDITTAEAIANTIEKSYYTDDRLQDFGDCIIVLDEFLKTGILNLTGRK